LILALALIAALSAQDRPALERALAQQPANVEAALALAGLFFQQGRIDDAIRALEKARDAGARSAALDARLERLRAERDLHAGFRQAHNPRFTILFAGAPEASIAGAILERLNAAWDRVSGLLFTVPGDVITVTLYTEQQFVDITRAPGWAAAAYDGRIRLPVRGALASTEELDRVLAHEVAHAFIRAAAPRNVPIWLDEGLASIAEPRDLEWARREIRRAGRLLSPDRLMTGSFRNLSDAEARVAYATSALLARALVDRHSQGAINALLADLGRGVPFDEAFRRRLFEPWISFFDRFSADIGVPYDVRDRP